MGQSVKRAERRRRQRARSDRARERAEQAGVDFRQQARARAADLQAEIKKVVAELLSLLRRVDPLQLMAILAFQRLLDIEGEDRPAARETVLGIAMALEDPGNEEPTMQDAVSALDLGEKILGRTMAQRILSDAGQGRRTSLDALSFTSMARNLYERGDSYAVHEQSLLLRIYEPHSDFLRARSLPAVPDYLACIEAVAVQVLGQQLAFAKDVAEGRTRPTAKSMLRALEIQDVPTGSPLSNMTLSFGSNAPMLETGPAANRVLSRPLVEHEGRLFCFDRGTLARARRLVLEEWLASDETYFTKRFSPARARATEDLVGEALSRLLPGARVLRQLYYTAEVEGSRRRCELDMLVLYDDRMFIVEVKSGTVSPAARRGAPKRLGRTVNELVDEPYRQALRARTYLEAENTAFQFDDGTEVEGVPPIRKMRGVYLLTVTLSDLAHVTGQLSKLRDLQLLEGRDWPWAVFINDLRVVSEILLSPAEFVLYLERRARLNDQGVFATTDELDYLGAFLSTGLYFEPGEFKDAGQVIIGSSTEDLDRYYGELPGDPAEGVEPPRFPISPWYRRFVGRIEGSSAPGRTEVARVLLSLDGAGQKRIEHLVRQAEDQVAKDGRPHDATLIGPDLVGVCVAFAPQLDEPLRRTRRRYARMKRHQLGLRSFALVLLEAGDHEATPEIELFEGDTQDTAVLDEEVRRFANARVSAAGRVGRNEPCPCNSGKKFKRCCGAGS